MVEVRDIPFRFVRPFRYAYEGIHVVAYEPGDCLVSTDCARIAIAEKAGDVVPAPKPARGK
jgi:hypothetical protein